MADQVSLSSSPAEKRFKFEPNEDYLDQLLAMGISLNGAKKVRFPYNIWTFHRAFVRGSISKHWTYLDYDVKLCQFFAKYW